MRRLRACQPCPLLDPKPKPTTAPMVVFSLDDTDELVPSAVDPAIRFCPELDAQYAPLDLCSGVDAPAAMATTPAANCSERQFSSPATVFSQWKTPTLAPRTPQPQPQRSSGFLAPSLEQFMLIRGFAAAQPQKPVVLPENPPAAPEDAKLTFWVAPIAREFSRLLDSVATELNASFVEVPTERLFGVDILIDCTAAALVMSTSTLQSSFAAVLENISSVLSVQYRLLFLVVIGASSLAPCAAETAHALASYTGPFRAKLVLVDR
jgi:hypothetical protein